MTRRSTSVIKVGVVDVDVRVSSHLKEELTWAIDKRLRVISTIMLFNLFIGDMVFPRHDAIFKQEAAKKAEVC